MALNINQRLNGLHSLSYMGDNAVQPPDFVTKPRPPTPTDSKNFALGDIWLDTSNYPATPPTNQDIWMLVALIGNAATWVNFAAGGTVTSVNAGLSISITGTAINPIVNVAGTVNHTVQLGNALGSLTSLANGTTGQVLTAQTGADPIWAAGGTGATSFPTDSGTATPIAGVLNINAGNAANNAGSTVLFSAPGPSNTVLLNVTNATNSTIIGKGAGNLTLTGANNTVLGALSAPALTSSPSNTIIGEGSATLLAGGSGLNTLIGRGVATGLVTGTANIIIGRLAGANLTGAESNNLLIADDGVVGVSGLIVISIPNEGDFIHNYPGVPASINGLNAFMGLDAGNFTMNVGAIANVGIGGQAMHLLVSGVCNTCVGDAIMFRITSGSRNSAFGCNAGQDAGGGTGITTGSDNCLFGNLSGSSYTGAESSNILVGSNQTGVIGESHTFRVGAGAGTGAGQLNRAFIHGIRGITTGVNDAIAVLIDSAGQLGTVSSSERAKEDINDMGSYSDVLRSLRPVTFKYKSHPAGSISVGLIAEEVAEVAPDLVIYDKEGLPETVRYADIDRMLLNEFQKHCKLIAELQSINADLLNRIRLLEEDKIRLSCH